MTASPVRTALLAAALACLLVGVSLAPATAAPTDGADETPSAHSLAGSVAAAADNETVRHQHPDEYDEAGDSEGLADWFERQLGERLGQSSVHLSQGEYEQASQYVDEEFEELLAEYVDVAGETDRDGRAEEFERAGEEHREAANATESFEDTYEEYEAAREAGDDERARELARELAALAEQLDDSSTALRTHYEALEADTGEDFSDPIDAIDETNESVQNRQTTIRSELFDETQLSVTSDDQAISVLDPLTATGQLTTADGEPVANEPIRLGIGGQSIETQTDGDGTFEFDYRPISVSADAATLTVEYVPEDASPYLGSETTVPVSIEPVEPTLDATASDESVAFGESFQVSATLAAGDVSLEDVPLQVAIDGTTVDTIETDSNGTVEASVPVPADVEAGEATVRVSLPFEDRALEAAAATAPVTIEESPSALSLEATHVGDGQLAVEGELTANETGVGDQAIDIRIDGTTAGTLETADNGTFSGTFEFPDDGSDVTVEGSFDGTGTSLAASEAATTLEFGGTGAGLAAPGVVTWWAAGVLAVVAVAIALAWWYDRRRRTGAAAPEPVESDPSADPEPDARAGGPEPIVTQAVLDDAESTLAAGRPGPAIERAYRAVRAELGHRHAAPTGFTHWEFLEYYRDRADGDEALRTITEGYERATFDPAPVDAETARTVLEESRAIWDESTSEATGDD